MTRFPASASRAATVPPPAPEPTTRYSQSGGCEAGPPSCIALLNCGHHPVRDRRVCQPDLSQDLSSEIVRVSSDLSCPLAGASRVNSGMLDRPMSRLGGLVTRAALAVWLNTVPAQSALLAQELSETPPATAARDAAEALSSEVRNAVAIVGSGTF